MEPATTAPSVTSRTPLAEAFLAKAKAARIEEPPRPAPLSTPPAPVFAAPPSAPLVSPPEPAPAPPLPSTTSGAPLTMAQVIDCAVRALAILKMRVSTITSVMPENDQWRVSVELVERRGIPDTNDVLGLYELRLDAAGNVLRYERTLMRRRCDFTR